MAKKTGKTKPAKLPPFKNPNAWALLLALRAAPGRRLKLEGLRKVIPNYDQLQQGIHLLTTWKIAKLNRDQEAMRADVAKRGWARDNYVSIQLNPRAQWEREIIDPAGVSALVRKTARELEAKRSKASKPKAKKASKRRPADKLEAAKKEPEIIRRRAPKAVSPRAFLLEARAKRRAELAEVRTSCKAGRVAVRTRYRDRFEKLKAALRRSLERAQRDHLADCKARRALIDSTFKAKAERAAQHKAERKRAAEERAHLRAKRGTTLKQIKALGRARDSRGEQLDRARYEVETQAPNMLALFDRVKRKLKLRAGFTSLAEVFFQFAHDHPEEVIASAQAKANKSAAAEIRAMAKGTRFERISGTICNKAARAFKSGRAFHLKAREEAALRAIGADPDRLMSTCYPRRRRVVSGREYRGTSKASEAPF